MTLQNALIPTHMILDNVFPGSVFHNSLAAIPRQLPVSAFAATVKPRSQQLFLHLSIARLLNFGITPTLETK